MLMWRPAAFRAAIIFGKTSKIFKRGTSMKRTFLVLTLCGIAVAAWLMAQPSGDPLIEGFRTTEVASVADAMEQLYGTRGYMSHEMRPLFTTKFAGPAVTVMLKKEEHKEGAAASSGRLD